MMKLALRLALALFLAGAGAALADVPGAALGSAGEIYQIRSGVYGALFPDGHEVGDPATPVLALDIQRPGVALERLLVPGSREADYERWPYLFLEKETNGVYLVWESRPNLIHSQLMLQAYADGAWSDPIVVSGSSLTMRSAPRLVLTHDTYQQKAADDTIATHRRTVIHLVWWEETSFGFQILYSPLVLVDGDFLGWNETFNLSSMTDQPGGSPTVINDLAQLVPPTIEVGHSAGRIVIGFTNLQSGRLVTIEVRSLSAALGFLAEDLRSFLLAQAPLYMPDRIDALGNLANTHLLTVGSQFDPDVLSVLAEKARGHIIGDGHAAPTRPRLLAEKARGHIIGDGAKLVGHGLRDEKGADSGQLIEVAAADRTDAADRPTAQNIHWIEMGAASSWPIPAANGDASTILLSEDGADAIVAWQDGSRILYRESDGSDWKAQSEIRTGSDLTVERAYAILERRLRAH